MMTPEQVAAAFESKDVAVVVGKRGEGKTTWLRRFWAAYRRRKLAWDPHREYDGRRVELDEFLSDTLRLTENPELQLLVSAECSNPAEASQAFNSFAGQLPAVSDCLTLVEEVGQLSNACRDWIDFIATQSRHWGAHGSPALFCAQRAVDIPKTARNQASYIVSFYQSCPDDIAALREVIGDEAEKVDSLPQGECVVWSSAASRGRKDKQP